MEGGRRGKGAEGGNESKVDNFCYWCYQLLCYNVCSDYKKSQPPFIHQAHGQDFTVCGATDYLQSLPKQFNVSFENSFLMSNTI